MSEERDWRDWKTYRKVQLTKMRPYEEGEDLSSVSVDPGYTPKPGDMLASDGKTTWLINRDYFDANYEEAPDDEE